MTPQTTIPKTGAISIKFPSQYLIGLGIDLILSTTCSHTCTINQRIVKFTLADGVSANTEIKLIIRKVKNPEGKGGTGNFEVRSTMGENIFDENLIFGTIGIGDYALDFNSLYINIDQGSTNIVGQSALYNFYIKPPNTLPNNFYLSITSPLTTDLSTCKLIPYNSITFNFNLKCVSDNGNILVTGFGEIEALTVFTLQINFMNPSYSQTTDSFQVIAYRQSTTMIYSWRESIAGVTISPGTLINSTINVESNNTAITTNFNIKFTTFNKVSSTGMIMIQMPLNYEIAYKTDYDYIQVNQGIIASNLSIVYDQYTVNITQFQEIDVNTTIEIIIRGSNPQISGKSQEFLIKTLQNNQIIDQITNQTLTTIDVSSLPVTKATLSVPHAKSSTNLVFTLNPNKLTGKSIQIDLGTHFTVGTITASNCLVQSVTSSSCTVTDTKIKVISALTISQSMTVQLNGILTNSDIAENGLIYYQIYDSTDAALDSGSVYFSTYPPQDSAASFLLIGKEISTTANKKYSTLVLQFKTIAAVPDNIITPTPTTPTPTPAATETTPTTTPTPTTTIPDPHGEIWLQFGSASAWDSSLGMTSVYCVTDLTPLENKVIECQLKSGDIPEISIKNFKGLDANKVINIRIPNILNPLTTSVTITAYSGYRQYSQRIGTTYATSSLTLSAQGAATWTTHTSSFSISSIGVNTVFSCTFTPGFTASIPSGSVIRIQLPTYSNGFLQNTVTCQIDSVTMPCVLYMGLDMIEITTSSAITSTSNKITLLNLKWPITSYQADFIKWIVFVSNIEQEKASVAQLDSSKFPAPTPNDFALAIIDKFEKGRGYPGQIFTFIFRVTNDVPDNSIMSLTFPSEFNIDKSIPTPTCGGYKINQIILKGIVKDTNFTITCQGIKTPFNPPDSLSDGWNIEIFTNSQLLNQRLNFASYTYSNLFSIGTISILSIQATPSNILETASYTIQFQLVHSLLEQAIMYITFPSKNYPDLPYPPNLAQCTLLGSLDSFDTCSLQGSTFKIVLNSKYSGGVISFSVNNVKNPSSLTTDGFTISTYYDSTQIDLTDESTLLNRTLTFNPTASSLLINSIEFAPQNQGVKASYTFNLSLSQSLTSSNQLIITFPLQFDQRLGDNLKAYINSVLIDITVKNRQVSIAQGDYGQQLILIIKNIINPNSNTDEFGIGIVKDSQYIYYNASAGVLEMMNPPEWLYLEKMLLSNYYSRWQSQYQFIVTLYNKLPNNGYLYIEFPSQYEISDANATCNFKKCLFTDNILKAYNDPINGNITFTATVENPLNEVTISDFIVRSQDDRSVVEQSYPNLDPFSFTFTYSGPLIFINNDQDIIVYQGTETPDLYFKVVYPQALNLTFKHTQTAKFLVIPKEVSFGYTTMNTTFRVQMPSNIAIGIYYIYWNTFGEKSIPFYTPVKKSKVIVQSAKLPISRTSLYPIPIGGESLPITISIQNAPYDGMSIVISSNDKVVYLKTDSEEGESVTLTYSVGVNSLKFRVMQNYTELIRQQQLGILSEEERLIMFTSNNNYYEPLSNLTVTLTDAVTEIPAITDFKYIDIQRTQVTITIITNQYVEAYYMYCLNRTTTPDVSELLNQGPPLHQTTLSKYGYLLINQQSTFTIQIYAQIEYAIYMVLRNQGNLYSKIFFSNFTSLDRAPIAEFTTYSSTDLTAAQKLNVMNSIAFVLSLPQWKIVEKKVYSDTAARLLQTTKQITLHVVPFNDTSNYPTPNELINKLITESAKYSTTYLAGLSFTGGKLSVQNIPNIGEISISNSYLYDCEIAVSLSTQGTVYAVASQRVNQSTPFQIFQGLDDINVKIPNANHLCENTSQQLFNISNLEPNNTYQIYLIAASDLPEYPDLNGNVSSLTCTTQNLVEREPYTISYALIIMTNLILYCVLLLQ